MPRKPREPISVKVVPVPASEAEMARVWGEIRRILAAAQAEPAPDSGPEEKP